MNSDPLRVAAEAVVEQIIALLDEAQIAKAVDYALDEALETFDGLTQNVRNRHDLHAVVASFVQHAKRLAPGSLIDVAPDRVLEWAVRLLDSYEGPEQAGYRAALLTVLSHGLAAPDGLFAANGLEEVLLSITFALKLLGRQQYRMWVLAHYVDPCDWAMCRAMAAVLLDRLGLSAVQDSLTSENPFPHQNTPDQWAHDLVTLCDEVMRLETISI